MPNLDIVDGAEVARKFGRGPEPPVTTRKAKPGEIAPTGEPEGWWALKQEPDADSRGSVADRLRQIEEQALELATRAASLREAIEKMHEANEQIEALEHEYQGARELARFVLFGGEK